MAAAPPEVLAGRFVLERPVFEGGMGAIWRAHDRETDTVVAVKRLTLTSTPARARFMREAKLLAVLAHPAIVRHVAHGETPGGSPYLAMEWVEGEDLATLFERGRIDAASAITLGRRMASALSCAHALGVVHRDLKPANVLLPHGRIEDAKLVDFGIARWRTSAPTSLVTQLGVIVGTPGYMAPEQAKGADDVDARADLFSLGCVLYEALAGQQAFTGETLVAVLAKLLVENPRPLAELRPDLPQSLLDLVDQLLAKRPSDRPRDGAEVEAALARIASEEEESRTTDIPAPPARAAPPSITPRERRLAAVIVAQPPGALELAPDRTFSDAAADGGTVADAGAEARALVARLAEAVAPYGGRFESLANGAALVAFTGGGEARDLAMRAARAALAIAQDGRGHDLRIGLATGWARLDGLLPVGEVIDRAARLARDANEPDAVRTDRATAALLGARFELTPVGDDAWLRGAHEARETERTLLGRASPHVGRAQELALLDATLTECVNEPIARVVVIRAEPGYGKSRLRREWLASVRDRLPDATVIVGHADELRARAPLAALAEGLRREAGVLDGERVEDSREKLVARVARHVEAPEAARLAAFLGELCGVPFDDAAHPGLRAARSDAILMADLVREAFVDLLFYETRVHPVVLVLEDLHWADAGTVQLVESALRVLADVPVLVLALARPEVSVRFPSLFPSCEPRFVDLGPLGKRACEKFVREVLGEKVDVRTVERVVTLAGGNPFLLEELVRAVAEGRGAELPDSVLASVQARLEQLEPAERHLLRAASVIGEVFWSGAVAQLAGMDDAGGVADILEGLAARELVLPRSTSRFPGEREHVFRHALVREAAYAMLTDEDRVLGHGLAAAWLEEMGETSPVALAEQLERSGDATRAGAWWLRAARLALEANDLDGALEHAQRGAARAASDDAMRGRLALVRAEVWRTRGDNRAALAAATEALAALPPGTDGWWIAARERVLTMSRLGEHAALPPLVAQMLSLYDGDAQRSSAVQSLATTAAQLLLGGRPDLYEKVIVRLPDDELMTEPRALATVLLARAMRGLFIGDLGTYVALTQEAGLRYREAGDARNVLATQQYLAYGYMQLGEYADAATRLREALAASERDGRTELGPSVRQNLGRALEHLGELDEALSLEQQSLDAALRQGDTRIATGARIYLASTLLRLGRYDDAERLARDALASAQTDGLAAYAGGELARVLLTKGDAVAACGEAEVARARLEQAGQLEEGESLLRLVLAEARDAVGDRPGAVVAIAEAKSRLMARALGIADPAWRERFLANVEDHRRTLELADRWNA